VECEYRKRKAMSSLNETSYEEKNQSLGYSSVIKDVYKDSPPLSIPPNFEYDTCNKQKFQ